MKKFMRIGAALFVAVAMLALIGCPTETETLETGAALLSVTIGGVSPTADDIPEGIPEAEWLSVGFDATSMETMLFRLDRTLFGTEGVYADAPVATSKSAGAKVYYGLSNAGLLPSEWVTTSTFNLRNQNVIYIAVESEDGFSRNYYRVRVYRENQSAAVNTLSIGGKVTGIGPADGGETPDGAVAAQLNLKFIEETTNVPVVVELNDEFATAQYIKRAEGVTTVPEFANSSTFATLDHGDTVFVKVNPSSADGDPQYYAVTISTTARISSLGVGGAAQAVTEPGVLALTNLPEPVVINRTTETVTNALSATAVEGVTVSYALLPENAPTPADSAFLPLADLTSPFPAGRNVLYIKTTAAGYQPRYLSYIIQVRSNDRAVTSVTIGGKAVTSVGTGAATTNVGNTARGAATIATSEAAGPIVVTLASDRATVTGWAINSTTVLTEYTDTASGIATLTLDGPIPTGQYLFLRIAAENETTIWYHRIAVTVQSNNATLSRVTVGDVAAMPTGAVNMESAVESVVDLPYATLSAGNVTLAVQKAQTNSVATYAKNTGAVPDDEDFETAAIGNNTRIPTLANGDYIWIKSVSQDTTNTLYYKIKVQGPEDVSGVYELTPNDGADILNPANLTITQAIKSESTVTLTLGGIVTSGLSDYMEANVYGLGAQGDIGNMAEGFSFISLDGLLEGGKKYSIKQTNQSLNLYAIDGEGFYEQGTDNVYKQSTTPELAAADSYTFLLWNGAATKTATIVITELDAEGDPLPDTTMTYVVDWSGVTINTENVIGNYSLPPDEGDGNIINPTGLTIASAVKSGSVVTLTLGGTVESGLSDYMENNMYGLKANGDDEKMAQGYSYISLGGILEVGTYTIRQTNQSLNLYETVDTSNIFEHGTDGVYKESTPTLAQADSYTFLLWNGAAPRTATIRITESTNVTTYVVDWSGVTINVTP